MLNSFCFEMQWYYEREGEAGAFREVSCYYVSISAHIKYWLDNVKVSFLR